MKRISKSLADTEAIAKEFLKFLEKEKHFGGPQIAGFSGDLGAGKTAFVQAVGRILGVKELITSPTFVIMKKYGRLVHIDAYRLSNGDELLKLNFHNLMADSQNLILIEWPENVASALPKNLIKVYFKVIDENTREIDF